MVVPVIMMIFIAMYQLFTITFAAQNAHLRAREYALHEGSYLGGRLQDTEGNNVNVVWNSTMRNYERADPNASLNVSTTSRDQSIVGVSSSGISIEAKAAIQ